MNASTSTTDLSASFRDEKVWAMKAGRTTEGRREFVSNGAEPGARTPGDGGIGI